MYDPKEELAYLAVPKSLLPETYKFVAEQLAGSTVDGGAYENKNVPAEGNPLPGGTVGGDLGNTPWSAAELAQLGRGTTATTSLVSQLMDVLAEEPGKRHSTTDLVERLGVERNSIRGALSALTRHIKKHYPGHPWPFDWEWGGDLGEGFNAEQYYSLDPETAVTWIEAHGA